MPSELLKNIFILVAFLASRFLISNNLTLLDLDVKTLLRLVDAVASQFKNLIVLGVIVEKKVSDSNVVYVTVEDKENKINGIKEKIDGMYAANRFKLEPIPFFKYAGKE